MTSRRAAAAPVAAVLVAAMAWSALLLQYGLSLWSGPWLYETVRFLSFFTILSNLLVALVATAAATGGEASILRWWRRPGIRGLASLCILVTFLIYAALLQGRWHPQGPQLVADRLLHYVVPFLYVAWWVAFVPHGTLRWSLAWRWLGFPLAFLAWTLVRGSVTGEYPYFFIDVTHVGYAQVMLNSLGIGVLFALLGLALIALDRVALSFS